MVWVQWASWLALCGVALGAFGAHGLRGRLSADALQIFHTAVFYHLIHAVALLGVGWLATIKPLTPWVRHAGVAFVLGVILFSGSLYLLSITGIKKLGMITPLGGLAFLIGWACLALAAR